MIIKKVFKYGTGQEIPEGAVYLCTKTEEETVVNGNMPSGSVNGGGMNNVNLNIIKRNVLVWHYFLVEVLE